MIVVFHPFVASSIRKISSIVCDCGWLVRFRGVEWQKCTNSDPVIITEVCGFHSNTCNPAFVNQFVLSRTRAGVYKKCDDHSLQEVMVQMTIEPFVSVRAIKTIFNTKIVHNIMITVKNVTGQVLNFTIANNKIEQKCMKSPYVITTNTIKSFTNLYSVINQVSNC